jgi:hypothetical protein
VENLKYWIKCILIDAALIAMLFIWQEHGNDGAGNVAVSLLWLGVTVRMTVGLFGDKSWFEKSPRRPPGFNGYNNVSELIFFAVLSYYGLFWLAGLNLLGFLFFEAARDREPKGSEV